MSSPPPTSDSPPSRARKSRRRGCLKIGLAVVIPATVILCAVAALAAIGLQDLNSSPLQVSDIRPLDLSPDPYRLSADQQDAIAASGYPDSFTILFYDDDFGGGSTRLETWIYSAFGLKVTFVNGQQEGTESFEALTGDILPAPYTPDQFTAYMSLEEVVAATDIDEFLLLPLERELVPGGESYFADRLTFGLVNDELMYVEAIGFEASDGAEVAGAEETPEQPSDPPPAVEPADPVSFEDFVVEQGYGWLAGYWADPALARSGDPLDFNEIYDVETGTAYDMAHAVMESQGYESFDAWLADYDASSVESFVVLRGFDLTYFSRADYRRLGDLAEAAGLTNWELVDMWDPDRTGTIRGILDTWEYADAGQWLDDIEAELATPGGGPLVYVSTKDDPDWPDCQATDQGCRTDLFITYPDAMTDIEVNLTAGTDFVWVSTPAVSHDGRRIAFEGAHNGGSDIYTINADGSNLLRITNGPGYNWTPAWSPDDDRIAFTSNRDGDNRWNIFIVDVATGDVSQVTNATAMDRFVDWSPDGQYLAFNSNRRDPHPGSCYPDCEWTLYMAQIGRRAVTALTDGVGENPGGVTWSPDGKLMAFHALRDGQYDLFLVDADLNITRLSNTPENEIHPAFSPDGTRLAFSSDSGGNWDIAITSISAFNPVFYTGHHADDFYPDW